ncbi:MAG TPA: hypothetical protein VIB39_19945 [Candidatus Angelobacter sp.]
MKAFVVSLLLIVSSLTGETSRGTVPRPDATGYAAHAGQAGLQIGASLLTHKEVKKTFASDLNPCCIVVEVAFYPAEKEFAKIVLDNFMLREDGKEIGAKPSTADVLAARLEVRPQTATHEPVGVSTTSGIGYERSRGVDPNTGTTTSRSGIYEHQGVGVGIPIGGKTESSEVAAESSRRAIEAELKEKMLPETSAWQPVAGYLYFSVPKKSKGGYELVYMLNDKKIVLPLK